MRGAERVARRRRPAVGIRHRGEARAGRGADRRRGGARHPAQRRLQRRHAGGRRLLPAHDPARLPLLDGGRLPAARRAPAEPDGGHRSAGHADPARRAARTRRDLSPARARRHGHGKAGRHRRRRRAAVAASAAALRHRAARGAAGARHPGQPRAPRRRREPAGPPAGARDLPLHQADHHQRHAEVVVAQDGDGDELHRHPDRPDGHRHQPGRDVRPHRSRAHAPGRAVPPRHAVLRHGRLAGAHLFRLHDVGVPAEPRVARVHPPEVARPARARPRSSPTTCPRRTTARRSSPACASRGASPPRGRSRRTSPANTGPAPRR